MKIYWHITVVLYCHLGILNIRIKTSPIMSLRQITSYCSTFSVEFVMCFSTCIFWTALHVNLSEFPFRRFFIVEIDLVFNNILLDCSRAPPTHPFLRATVKIWMFCLCIVYMRNLVGYWSCLGGSSVARVLFAHAQAVKRVVSLYDDGSNKPFRDWKQIMCTGVSPKNTRLYMGQLDEVSEWENNPAGCDLTSNSTPRQNLLLVSFLSTLLSSSFYFILFIFLYLDIFSGN